MLTFSIYRGRIWTSQIWKYLKFHLIGRAKNSCQVPPPFDLDPRDGLGSEIEVLQFAKL